MKRNLLPVFGLSAALLLLAGCGTPSSLLSIKKDKVVLVATVPFEAPLLYQTGGEGLVGPEAEVAAKIVEKVNASIAAEGDTPNVVLRWIIRSYGSLIAALENEEAHAVIAVFGVNEDRKRRVDFSTPVYTSSLALVINPVRRDLRPGILSTANIGVRADTEVQRWVKRQFSQSTITPFKTLDDAVLALRRGEVDGLIADRYMAAYALATLPGSSHLEILPEEVGRVECAVAVRKDDPEMLKLVEEAVAEVKQGKQYEKWLAEHDENRLEQVVGRHGERMKRELGPRKIRIQVSKAAGYDFDIYRIANLTFQLVNQQSGKSHRSSRIRFRRRVGSCQAEAPPGSYALRLAKFKFPPLELQIDKEDGDEVNVSIRISGTGITLQKS